MFNARKWVETSPTAATITVLAAMLTCLLNAMNTTIDLFSKASVLRKHPVVQIVGGDFQSDKFDRIFVKISNPRRDRESFSNLMLECDRRDGRKFLSQSLNDVPDGWNLIDGLRRTPINIDGGGTDVVALLFAKNPTFRLNQQCQNLMVWWNDNSAELLKGELFELPPNVTGFQNIELRPGWPR